METISININLSLQNEEKQILASSHSRLALIGPSGCGKSSLVKVLVGVNDNGQGSFKLYGEELMKRKAWERGIGYTPQDLILMPHLSVRENLLFPVNSKLNDEVNQGLGITHLLERMPRHLSGGEKQRVALARSLSSAPQLLILDEPFSSLDTKTKDQVIELVDHFATTHKIPLIFISHDAKEINRLGCETFFF